MMFDKKKAAHIILSKKGKEHEEKMEEPMPHMAHGGAISDPGEMVDHDFAGLHAASQDLLSAIHSKSPMDVHKALHSYLELRKQLEPGEEAEDGYDANEKGSEAGAQYKYNK